MPARPVTITQLEISRTVRGVVAGGVVVGRVDVDHVTGRIVVWPAGAIPNGASAIDAMAEGFK